jgi:putative transposase
MEAYVSGVSTRKVDELVAALGCESGISKSEVSRICQGLDTQVQAFLSRPLEFSRYHYDYLDATYLHSRDPVRRQVISRAVIVAVGITGTGPREMLGIEDGDSEDEAFWTPAPAHMAPGQLADPPPELLVLDRRHRHGPALRGAVLAHHPADQAL